METRENKAFLTRRELAERWRVSIETVRLLTLPENPVIPVMLVGRAVRVPLAAIEAYEASRIGAGADRGDGDEPGRS